MRSLGVSAETALSLHQASTGPLDQLRSITEHTLHVAILDGTDVLYVERRESPRAMAVFSRVGARNAAHVTSTGKVLLAYLEPDEQTRVVGSMRLTRKTPHTITTKPALLAELTRVRRQGFGENVFESELGMVSVAAPIRGRTGRVVAALSVVGHVEDGDPETIRRFTRPLVEAAGRISHNLGWRRPGHGEPIR
jgi:DNA-binding IclR family transcriptional regulator